MRVKIGGLVGEALSGTFQADVCLTTAETAEEPRGAPSTLSKLSARCAALSLVAVEPYVTQMKRRDLSITAILTVFAAAVASASPLGPALFPHHEGLIFWGSVGVGGAALLCLIPFFIWQPRKEIDVSDDAEVGEDNVVMGKHNFRKIGNRNVIIGATDDRGNTILNKPMTVGYGARGGPGSIVIGAFAGAGAAPAAKPKDDGGTDVP